MSTYIETFRSGMREVQSRQVLSLLTKEKDRGTITSVQEFKDRLQEVTTQLQSNTLTPTLTLFLAQFGEIIDSESYSFMIERIADDLEAAYEEMNSIDEVLSAHETIINDVVLKNLEIAVNQLESNIAAFEFLSKNQAGFDNAVFNTFRITQNNRTTSSRQVLFTDPKTGVTNLGNFSAFIDTIGEKLILKPQLEEYHTPATVRQVFDSEAIASELNVEFDGSNINNIIDNTTGTFWVQSTLLTEPRDETGVITKLEIDLGAVRSINFIQIEPISLYPLDVVSISIIDPNNQSSTILTNPVPVNNTNRFYFNTASASKVIVKFRNRNYGEVQFVTKPGSPIPELTRGLTGIDQTTENISEDLNNLATNPILKDALSITEFTGESQSFNEYLFGLDNIRLGLANFIDTSIFVSQSQKVNALGQLALRIHEKRPIGDINSADVEYTDVTYPTSYDDYYHGSLEYYVIKRDFSDADAILDLQMFPLVPLQTSAIRHETLYLSRKSSGSLSSNDTGILQHFTLNDPYHPIDNADGTVRVYRNGVLLPNADASTGPNAASEPDGWLVETNISEDQPGQGTRMQYAIQIQQPNPNNIYTVSYTPAKSTTNSIPNQTNLSSYLAEQGLRLVDLTGELKAWLGNNNIVYFRESKLGSEIAYSTINLVVMLRRNSANANLTPVLEDYLIATGSRDSSKF